MARARMLLSDKNAQTAVEVLEDQLPKVNGNMEYLVLLREAYRAHIKDLQFAGQGGESETLPGSGCAFSIRTPPTIRR